MAALLATAPQVSAVAAALTPHLFACHFHKDAARLLIDLGRESYDVLLIDWAQRPAAAVTLLERLSTHEHARSVPVLALDVPDQEAAIVEALAAGAHNCLHRPLDGHALRGRVIAAARRSALQPDGLQQLRLGPFVIDLARARLHRGPVEVSLKRNEFDVALTLFQYTGRAVSRGHLLETVWRNDSPENRRLVDSCVYRVRSKMDLRNDPQVRIVTLREFGYRLEYTANTMAAAPPSRGALRNPVK